MTFIYQIEKNFYFNTKIGPWNKVSWCRTTLKCEFCFIVNASAHLRILNTDLLFLSRLVAASSPAACALVYNYDSVCFAFFRFTVQVLRQELSSMWGKQWQKIHLWVGFHLFCIYLPQRGQRVNRMKNTIRI